MNDMTTQAQHRLEWIDAMRGFTMILVVAYHVALQGFCQTPRLSASMPFWVLFRMPLFFFISGFLAYRRNAQWSFSCLMRMTGKKVRVQLVPTVVFFLAAMLLLHPSDFPGNVVEQIHSPTKGGYWFTLVLLYMFIIYYLFTFIEHRFSRRSFVPVCILWLLSIGIYETAYMPSVFWYAFGNKATQKGLLFDTSLFQVMLFFQFFIYGNIVRRYWHRFEKLCSRPGFYLLILGVAFFSSVEFLGLHWLKHEWANLSRTIAMYALLTLVFLSFRYYQAHFTKQTRTGRVLQYIGTRTLDIYLLHFLFIPYLPEVGKYFNGHQHNFLADTTASVAVGFVVIAFCLLTSNILRISPFLKKYLFGREERKTITN
ncbi:MAG: acyltransferase [Bacteroidaceae bacterium]|nr:acyltransferase [Bacteroidaceae bacterium]